MNTEQKTNNNQKENNDNLKQDNDFISKIKNTINKIEKNEELCSNIINQENIQKDKTVLKTENQEKDSEKKTNIKIEDNKDDKQINLVKTDTNNYLKDKNNNDSNNCLTKKLTEEKNIKKNNIEIIENQDMNKTSVNIINNNPIEKTKEDNIITSENIINKENLNQNEIKNNEVENNNINNKKEILENEINPKNIELNGTVENKNKNDLNIKHENEDKEIKHKFNGTCLNKCFKWILNIQIKNKDANIKFPIDFKTQYTLQGTSIFFKKLEQSLINCLHNCQNISSSLYRDMPYKLFLNSIKIESSKKLELLNQNTSEQKTSLKDLFNYSYPIDNTKSNYLFINSNLSMKENLKNIFLIEFDLDQTKEENINQDNQDFRKINDFCVEREIEFKLNGFFHGKKIFKNDLNFSAGYREFIKSVQMQLKNKFLKNKNNQNLIFGKILNNANLALEFFVPSFNENSQTNFNAVVNSHIEIKKIFLELTIPNNVISNKSNMSNMIEGVTEDSNSISTKRTEINSPKKEENNISISNSNQNSNKNLNFNMNKNNIPNINPNFISNMKNYIFNSPNPNNLGINRSIPASPHLNNIPFIYQQQKFSPLINPNFTNNNLNPNLFQNNCRPIPNQNSFYSATPIYPLSPAPPQPQQIFGSPQPLPNINTFSPLSASLMMMKMPYPGRMVQQQPLSMNSPFNTSNYSSPYLGQNINRNTISLNSSNNRKYSESFQNENQINNYQRNVYNSNNRTPLMMRGSEEELMNQLMSPKSMGPSTSFNLANNMNMVNFNLNSNINNKNNRSLYQLNPMNNINQMKQQMNQMGNINQMGNVIPVTIRQKIFEKTKNEEVDKINKLLNTMNRMRPTNNNMNLNNNNINNINNINNFNNSSSNNIIRTNIIKNNMTNMISNINLNTNNNINNFNNINTIKNLANIHNIQNNPNIQNMMNTGNNININLNNINRISNNMNYQMNVNYEKGEMNVKQKIKNIFIQENQNKSNFDLFLKSVTPTYKMLANTNFSKIKIKTIFESLKLISLLGLKTIYYNNGELLDIWYSLTFSSLIIKITNKQLITQILEEIRIKRNDLGNLILNQNEEIVISESLFTLYFTTEYLDISFIETKPDYSRKSYNSIINSLLKLIPCFDQIMLEDIDIKKSYYALLYSSVKILKPFTPHSFVMYYNFNNEIIQENKNGKNQNNERYYRQIIVGILPIKVNEDFFMKKIIYKQPLQSFRIYNQDNFPLINMTYNVLNDIQKSIRGNSYDFELFIKLKNYNYNK